MREVSERYESIWDKKSVLRTVYGEMFDRISRMCVPGTTLEIGGGIGNLKSRRAEVISSDIQLGRGLDLVADAQRLPFRSGSLSNIVMLDVLHHIQYPALFFREAERALRPGGRIVMIEPAITWGSSLFYRLLHQEPVDMSADPLVVADPDSARDPVSRSFPCDVSHAFDATAAVVCFRRLSFKRGIQALVSCAEWRSQKDSRDRTAVRAPLGPFCGVSHADHC